MEITCTDGTLKIRTTDAEGKTEETVKPVSYTHLTIYGQPGAYLKFGEIDSAEYSQTAIPQSDLGTNGKQTAQLYIGCLLYTSHR